MSLTDKELRFLQDKANDIRQSVVKSLLEAGSGHSAGSLGTADIFAALYFNIMNRDPKNPEWEDRDRFILSNGHICPVLYATLAHAGYLPVSELKTLRKLGTRLQGHPHKGSVPGIEASGGPLGQGISIAAGMALAALLDKKKHHVYCMMGDGEQNEGQVWEAIMFAGKYRLHNLTCIINRNNIQIDGFTEDVMPLEPLKEKYEAFGWHVLEIDGHNLRHIVDAFNESKAIFEKPSMIIAHTIPGKNVDFMEENYEWHGKTPNKQEAEKALEELKHIRSMRGKITCGDHEC